MVRVHPLLALRVHKRIGCLRSDGAEAQEAVFLNRVLRWDALTGRAELEADTRHADVVVRDLGLGESRPVSTPAVRKPGSEVLVQSTSSPRLQGDRVQQYRPLVMRLNYIAQHRPDLSQATCSLARGKKDPREFHWEELKRVGRYLKGAPVGRSLFEARTLPGELTVYCDADHAGDVETRKSRSGVAIMWGGHLLKHGSCCSEHHCSEQRRVRVIRHVASGIAQPRRAIDAGGLGLRRGAEDCHQV